MPRLKLKKGDIPFAEIYKFSKEFYYKQYDNKSKRMKMDVTSARLIKTNNFDYDPKVKAWKQNAEGIRHIKFEFIVSSSPISYKKGDTINVHKYPVTFVFFNLDMGWNSPFRWRTGSFKKVRFANKGASKEQRLLIANANIKNGKQLDFFFKLEALLSWYGLLYGPDTTNRRLPVKANPDLIPFFDKTSLYIVEKVLRHLLSKKGIVKIKEKIK